MPQSTLAEQCAHADALFADGQLDAAVQVLQQAAQPDASAQSLTHNSMHLFVQRCNKETTRHA